MGALYRAPPFPLPPGEIFELKAELNSDKKEKKKEAVKKVIASMTVGKDVRCVAVLCRACLGQIVPGGCPDGLWAPVFPHCLRWGFHAGFCLWQRPRELLAAAIPPAREGKCLCKRGRLAGGDLPGFGSNLAKRGLVWPLISLFGLLLLHSSVTKNKQKAPLSLYGRGSVSLPWCR